jgi:hypothetical protein
MVPGGFQVSLLVLKAAGRLFELEAQLVVAWGTAKREEFRVMPAAHIAQPKVPKPPRRSAEAANRSFEPISTSFDLSTYFNDISTFFDSILIQFNAVQRILLKKVDEWVIFIC